MKDEWKIDLAGKLAEYPLLRVLLYEKWFRVGFALFLLVLFGGLLCLPKIWVTSPKGVPVVKVSVLDLAQTWSLSRTARNAAAEGRYDEADYAWQAAFGNNRGDVRALRDLLKNFIEHERALKQTRYVLPQALWLLRLTRTNITDLELAAEIIDRKGHSEFLVGLLGAKKDSLSARLESLYLKALFNTGNFRAFDTRWEEVRAKVAGDPAMQLYRAGYLAAWGPPAAGADALAEIDQAVEDPARRTLACQMRLLISARRGDVAEYEKYLRRLEEWRADTLRQHLAYWRLLLDAGRTAQAIELARSYPHPPATPNELIGLARLFETAGQRGLALDLFKRFTRDFGYVPSFWTSYAELLMEAQKWPELRELGTEIRSFDSVAESLASFSYFVEGRAEVALDRPEQANAAFAKMLERRFEYPHLALRAASELYSIQRAPIAEELLKGLETDYKDEASYWLLRFSVAHALKQPDLLLRSAQAAYALQPKNPSVLNNYAAVLLIQRQQPEEAVRLTLQLYQQNPKALATRVNHAAALLLNGRAAEAEALLNTVRTNALNAEQMTMFSLDLTEMNYQLGRPERARHFAEQVDEALLYPAQRDWLKKVRTELAKQGKGAAQ